MARLERKTEYTYKLFRVKRRDGRSTTVSVDPVLVSVAIRAVGDARSVARLVRRASLRYDEAKEDCSRSRFVQRELVLMIRAAE